MRFLTKILSVACWFWVGVAAVTPSFAAKGTLEEQQAEVRTMRDQVLADLYRRDASLREKINRAEGYAVFSNVGVNLIFASVAGGKGIVVDRRGKETFMKMASGGFGLGLGVKDFRAVFVFKTKPKLAQFIQTGWDFGAQADAAAQSGEKGGAAAGAATVLPDVDVYQITKNGVALQATLQGTKYWRDADLNK
jgi:lipid-binding SYLF domain-containing protein